MKIEPMRTLLALAVCAGGVMANPQITASRTFADHLEVDLVSDSPLELAFSSCLSDLQQTQGQATLYVIPRGFTNCLVELKSGDQVYRLLLSNPGESGFNVILGGSGQMGPAGISTYGGKLSLSGGVGDFHLNGELNYTSTSPLDGKLRLRYQGTVLDWADSFGVPGHPAGSTGAGFYAAQDLWIFTVAAAAPLSAPPRVGLGINTPNLCGGGSISIEAKDIILWLSGGFEGFSARVQYQPKRANYLDYEGEYRNTPAFHLHFGGTELAGYAEIWGLIADPSFDWLRYKAKLSLDTPGLSSEATLDFPFIHAEYSQTPTAGLTAAGFYRWLMGGFLSELRLGGRYAPASASYGELLSRWMWNESWGTDLGVRVGTLGVGGLLGLGFQYDLEGFYKVVVGLEADNIALPSTYKATAQLILRGLEGWQLALEASSPFGQPSDSVIKLRASQWFFTPVDPPSTGLRWMEAGESVPQPATSYCWRWR